MTEFTKEFIAGQKRIFDNPELDISVWVTESWSNYYPALEEIERLQGLISAYENDMVLLDVTEKLKKAEVRIAELAKENQAIWEEWLEKIEERWAEEDKQELKNKCANCGLASHDIWGDEDNVYDNLSTEEE